MDHHAGPLNMPEKLISKACAFRSPLNQSRNIRNDKTTASLQVYNSQIWIQSSKMIVGYFGICIADSGEQRGFSHIGETDESHIGDNLQLQPYLQLLSRLTWLGVFGHLHGRRGKIHISLSATSPLQNDLTLIVA